MTHRMKTGVCYYPEHWPETNWQRDAMHMRQLGLSVVRIGEFAWSRLEPSAGKYEFDWLARAIETLHEAGLSIVLGTPTATPPRWLLNLHPDMLGVDEHGATRGFGSRRHYCFSSPQYREECTRICTVLAKRFGDHPAIIAWQTDNEYGCHNTTLSYSPHALNAFRCWCQQRYGNIHALNDAWGNVFWSMEYTTFDDIGLPVGTVAESNPAHQLAWWRFSSDQVRSFNRLQVDILRKHSPGRDILHNFMGNFVEFDHHGVSQDLDIATWDNYPIGFLTRDGIDSEDQSRYLRTGHPDSSAFHHELYRGCCKGRWWVMEQQPGPVNWAPYNPSPLPGMVRLWGWEAFAHGAEVMSYFRWRQAPFAQEQSHTGLLLSNGEEDVAAKEVAQLGRELVELDAVQQHNSNLKSRSTTVALVFDYAGIAMQDIQPPGGVTHSALIFCQRVFGACRQLGVDVDIVSPKADMDDYSIIMLCVSTESEQGLADKLASSNNMVVLFPGTGSKTHDFSIPDDLPPGSFRSLIDVKVIRSESLPPDTVLTARGHGTAVQCSSWREYVESPITPEASFADHWGFHYRNERAHYFNALPDHAGLMALLGKVFEECGISVHDLGPNLRTHRCGNLRLAFNFGSKSESLDDAFGVHFSLSADTPLLIGQRVLEPAEVAVWVVA